MMKKNSGYTLVELMIALVLGLIIVLVAVQMLLSGQRSLAFQTAMLNVQDNANIGLNYIVTDLKHTNLNLINRDMTNTGISGLIVDNSNYPEHIKNNRKLSDSNAADSLAKEKSDVLVIQYKPTLAKGYDCEGNEIDSTDKTIVQRYFLRKDKNGESHDLALVCDAGRYSASSTDTGLSNNDDEAGQIIMQRVDQFKVLVGVQNFVTSEFSYMTLSDFADIEAPENEKIRAVSLQVGILARSLDNAGTDTVEKLNYTLLNTPQEIKKPKTMNTKYIRVPVEQTVALRNGIGDRL